MHVLPLKPKAAAALLLVAALGLGGCVVAAVGAAGTAGYVAAQDRSTGTVIDDASIRTGIAARLFDKSESLYADVSTEVVNGEVLLTGNVPKAEDRVEAARIAWTVPGVRAVNNEIQVTDQGGAWNYTKDAWITTQVKTALLTDTDIRSLNYTVETNNQVVYLTGIAQNQAELDRAINHARNVSGVTRVVTYVQLAKNVPAAASTATSGTVDSSAAPAAAPQVPVQSDVAPPPPPPATGGRVVTQPLP